MAELKASPRNSALGAIADALGKARDFGDRARIPLIDMGLGELLLGKTPEEINEWAYGNAPLQIVGRGTGSRVPQLKQGRAEQLADAIFTAPMASPLVRMARAVPRALEHGAKEFAHASAAANPRAVKERGGHWLRNEGTRELDQLLQTRGTWDNPYSAAQQIFEAENPKAAALNSWIKGPLTNYVKRDLGSAADPLLRLAEQGISPLSRDELLNTAPWMRNLATKNRWLSGLEQPELSGPARGWSNRADAFVRPTEVGGMRTGLGDYWKALLETATGESQAAHHTRKYWPELVQSEGDWLGRLPDDTKVYQFAGDESPYHLGFDKLVGTLKQGLNAEDLPPHLVLTPEKLKQMGVEKAVRYQHDLGKFLEQRQAQELLETGRLPAFSGTPRKQFEGFSLVELDTPTELTPEMLKHVRQNPDGTWSPISASGKVLKRKMTPQSELVDIVEDTPERAILGGRLGHEGIAMNHCVGGYCDEVAAGNTRILSLRKDGMPHVTMEINPNDLEFGQPTITQIYGKANSAPKEEYRPLIQQYIRENNLIGDTEAMRNAGLYPVRTRQGYFTKDELRRLVDEGDVDAKSVWESEFGDWEPYKDGGLVEMDDDFAYPGMF